MANSNRSARAYLTELKNNPDLLYKEGFAPLIRYLDANSPLTSKVGYSISPKSDLLRFGQTPLLHFFPAPFTNINSSKVTGEQKLKNSYLGMLGINGPLPTHLTEYAIERNYRIKDKTFIEFLDLFNHRFISLFYRVWADSEPTVNHDRVKDDNYLRYLQAISGSNTDDINQLNETNIDHHLSGLLSHKNRSAKTLEQILSSYLNFTIQIDEFTGQWLSIPVNDQLTLGQNSSLGIQSTLGGRVYERMYSFVINIGPINYNEYINLLKRNEKIQEIIRLTRKFLGEEYDFSINILLEKHQTQACVLGKSKLGQTSWCQNKESYLKQNKSTIAYTIEC